MKLIAMKFRGFGPYKGEYAIDFAALTRSRMFLIDGQTGAGKTTILDCLSFALYGSISGGETASNAVGKQRERSRFLTDERTETYVDLIFRVGDDYYEVRRTPQYQQPKARGEGTVAHNATAKLMRLDPGIGVLAESPVNDPERYFDYAEEPGHAEAIVTRVADVAVEIPRLIGLDRNQFARTIMLAQGQFAIFLSMKPKERTDLIKDLFGARVYERIQQKLDDLRKDMQRETDGDAKTLTGSIGVARRTARDILDRRGLTDDDPEPELLSDGHWGLDRDKPGELAFPAKEPDEIRGILRRAVTGVDAECDALSRDCEEQATRARTTLDAARTLHGTATALRDAAARERADVASLLDLAAKESDISRARDDLERADEAQPIIDLGRELTTLREERDRLSADADLLRKRLDVFPARNELETQREQALQRAAEAQTARRDLERADDHERLIAAAARAVEAHERALSAYETARAGEQEARTALDGLPSRKDIDGQLQEIAERLGGADGLDKELTRAEHVLEQARNAERGAELIPELERRSMEAETAQAAAERTARTVRESIDRSGAAKYAARLRDGQPCPVCGSVDHPHPAVEPDDAHEATELEELAERAEEKRRAAEQARAAVSDARHDLAARREQCEGLTVEQARTRVESVKERIRGLDGLRKRQLDLRRTGTAIDEAEDAAQTARQELAAAAAKESETRSAAADAARAADGHDARSVERERADAHRRLDEAEHAGSDAERLKRTLAERDDVDGRHTERRAQADAASRLADEGARRLERALESSERFATLQEALDAGMEERDRRTLRDDIRRHDDETKAARANLRRSRADLRELVAGLTRQARLDLGLPEQADDDAMDGRDETASTGTTASLPAAYGDDGTPTPLGDAVAAIDVAARLAAVREAERRDDEAGRLAGEIAVLKRNWTEQASDMARAAQRWERTVARFEPVRRMAHLAKGDGDADAEQRMDLTTYAVAERFRDVLDRANELLDDIQGGIYELRLDEAGGPASMRTGLALTVFDRRTEQERDPGTLSGGETFFVSLALALALADIIQAENGGVSMDTLFVDEGFGTLSEDYLSDVMDMLHRISRTRDVGIISHVDWLRDQIAERISVSRVTPDGESRLEVTA